MFFFTFLPIRSKINHEIFSSEGIFMSAFLPVMFCLVYFTSYITRINYGAVIAEVILDLGITKGEAGLAVTGCFIFYGLGQPIVGWLGDRIAPKHLITIGLLGTAICNGFASMQKLPSVIAVIWCFNGFFQSMIWPPLVRIMAETMSGDSYRKTCVNVITAANAGTVLVYLAAPMLIRIGTWRLILILPSAIAVLTALIWLLFVKAGQTSKMTPKTDPKSGSMSIGRLSAMSGIPFILCAILLQGFLKDGITTWMPSYINESFSLGTGISILTTTVLPVFAIICVRISAKVYDRCRKNELIASILFFGIASVSCILLYLNDHQIVISVVLMAIICGCSHAVNQMLISNMPVRYTPYGRVSTISGVFNAFTYVGSSLSAYGFAALADRYGWKPLILVWAFCSVGGTVMCVMNLKKWTGFIVH